MASASGSGKAKGGGGHGGTSESGKRYKFDAALIDAQLMKRCDSRISEADWKNLITYWRSSVFESRSAIAKKNHASVSYIQQQESCPCY